MKMGKAGDTIMITELERRQIVEYIEQALVEMDESDEISQGSIDGLVDALAILGVKRDDIDRDQDNTDTDN